MKVISKTRGRDLNLYQDGNVNLPVKISNKKKEDNK